MPCAGGRGRAYTSRCPMKILLWKLSLLVWGCRVAGASGALQDTSGGEPSRTARWPQVKNFTTHPSSVEQIYEGDERSVRFALTLGNLSPDSNLQRYALRTGVEDDFVAEISWNQLAPLSCDVNNSTLDAYQDRTVLCRTNFTVKGLFIGKTSLDFMLLRTGAPVQKLSMDTPYVVTVIRRPRPIDTAFVVIVAVLTFVNTVVYGCKVDLRVVWQILKKPFAPLVGLFCQFVLLPPLCFGIVRLLNIDNQLGLGLFALGCSPSGGASNVWTILLDGDLHLSITMTFLSNVLSMATMPLWIFTLGRYLVDSGVTIPYENIVASLATLVVACGIGIVLRHYREQLAERVARFVKLAAFLFILVIIVLGIVSNIYMMILFVREWKIFVSGMLVPWLSLAVAAILGMALRLPWYQTLTIAIETTVQNTGVPIVLMRASLPQPEGDLGSVMPVAAAIFTPVPLLIGLLCLTLRKRFCPQFTPRGPDDPSMQTGDGQPDAERLSNGEPPPGNSPASLDCGEVMVIGNTKLGTSDPPPKA